MSANDCVSNWAVVAPIPMVLVDADLRVRWLNEAGTHYFARIATVILQGGRLDTASDLLRGPLVQLVTQAGPLATLHVIGRRSDEACLITSQRLPAPNDNLIMLMLRPAVAAEWLEGIPLADIAELFELTETETIVVRRLMSNQSPLDIASALNIKLGTIRTHVRNIYAKMGVSTREGLFLRCLPFAWLETVD